MSTFHDVLSRVGKWVTSSNEEQFSLYEIHDTKQAAIDAAEESGYVGRIEVPLYPEFINADSIIENIVCDHPDDFGGDWWVDELSPSQEQLAELQDALRNAMHRWLDTHDLWPSCSNVADVESFEITVSEGGGEAPARPADAAFIDKRKATPERSREAIDAKAKAVTS